MGGTPSTISFETFSKLKTEYENLEKGNLSDQEMFDKLTTVLRQTDAAAPTFTDTLITTSTDAGDVTPLKLNFTAVKDLWFTAASGGRGKSLVYLKDTVKACEHVFRMLHQKFSKQGEMSVIDFREAMAVSNCGIDESVIDSNFYESTSYPDDEDDESEVLGILADVGQFASAVVRIANTLDLQETGQSDKGLHEQLIDWLTTCSTALGIDDESLQSATSPSALRDDSFFTAPESFCDPTHVFLLLDLEGLEGRVELELDASHAPRTAYNFKCLCTGERGMGEVTGLPLSFKGSAFHRVVPGLCVQGGDFESGDGFGGESVYGGSFDDENLTLTHDKEGLLSMGNAGPDTNTSQFFITLAPAQHLDSENCIFGKVVSGMEFIRLIGQVPSDEDDRPSKQCIVKDCGLAY